MHKKGIKGVQKGNEIMKSMDERLAQMMDIVSRLGVQNFFDRIDVDKVATNDGIRHKKVPYGHRDELLQDCTSWESFENAGNWGEPDGHDLFRVKLMIPEQFCGKEVFFNVFTGEDDLWNTDNPQLLIYVNGQRRTGMDLNHNLVSIYTEKDWKEGKDRVVDIGIYAYSNFAKNENSLHMWVQALDRTAMQAFFDFSVALDAVKAMLGIDRKTLSLDLIMAKPVENGAPIDEKTADVILSKLEEASNLLVWNERESRVKIAEKASLEAASRYLQDNLYGTGDSPAVVSCIGHTHIDVAWKWPVRQTREKVIRSYSTVMELMKRYPEYLFMASTPQMYEFVREEEPELFEEIKERVKEGRFEVEGAMWLEADCNLTSGESLVRQILYGKQYFKNTFDKESTILWLPDVFGYSAAMPQILKKSGIRAFMTTKLAWNDTNRMPHDLFMWEGIDGTRIPTYIITTCDFPKADQVMKEGGILNYTYNGRQDASQIMGTWRAFREKEITDEVLSVYGFGDGGGGPTWEMLEMDRRLKKGLPGVPKTQQKTVTAFFDDLLENIKDKDVPVWDDELYLEFHRGTYTSIGKNKRYNRRLEYLLKEAETLCTMATITTGVEYPRDRLLNIWKVLMLNQFHDILPGSSIEEVYTTSWQEYESAIEDVKSIIDGASKALSGTATCVNFARGLSSEASGQSNKGTVQNCQSMINSGPTALFTPYYSISIDENGEIVSLVDRETGREIRNMSDDPLNRLIAFEDKPLEYDAWNIDADFEKTSWDIVKAEKVELRIYGDAKQGKDAEGTIEVCVERKFRESTIWQTICFYQDSRRIDFKTKVDWHQHQTLLKAAFPVDIETDNIDCEIQFGSIKRSLKRETTWEKAKFECCAHKWIDMSEKDASYGVAVLNDSKYGYDAKDKLMRLTLIKSGIFPNPNADQGEHEFTYSLFPHLGDYRKGRVIEEARTLNESIHYYKPECCEDTSKLIEVEKQIIEITGAEGVFVDAIKLSEDSKDVIIRLYEGYGETKSVKAALFKDLSVKVSQVYECDLLEKAVDNADLDFNLATNELSFEIKPFEIRTFRLKI